MSSPRAISPEMRYSKSMALPPESFACPDKPIADQKKDQNRTDKNQISHLKFPPILFSIINFNHLHINSVSKIRQKSQENVNF
jgi:hypothetical protein